MTLRSKIDAIALKAANEIAAAIRKGPIGEIGEVGRTVPRTKRGSMRYGAAKARAIAEFERAYVDELMAIAEGNVARAAEIAGVSRIQIYRVIARVEKTR